MDQVQRQKIPTSGISTKIYHLTVPFFKQLSDKSGDKFLDDDVLARLVLPGDEAVGKSSPRGLVLARPGVSRVTTDPTLPAHSAKLVLEAPAESLVVVEVRGVVVAQPPHGGPGGRLHQPGVGLHLGDQACQQEQEQEKEQGDGEGEGAHHD